MALLLLKPDQRLADPQVAVVGFYPWPETKGASPEVVDAWEQPFKALRWTFGVQVQMVESPEEIMFRKGLISVEESTNHPDQVALEDFEHPRDATYVVGNSMYRWISGYMPVEHRVFIPTGQIGHPLYGDQALTLVLHDRLRKQNGKSL